MNRGNFHWQRMTKTLNRQAIHCNNNPFFYFRPTQSSFPPRFIMKTSQEAKRSIPFRLASSSASQFCITELGGATSHTSGPVPEPIVSAVIAPQSPYRWVSEETEQSDSFFFYPEKKRDHFCRKDPNIFPGTKNEDHGRKSCFSSV